MKNFRLNHNELLQSLGLPTSSTEDLFETKPKNFNVTKRDNINRELILCMTIDLGDGKNDVLNIYSNDDPKDLARHFCIKNHLNMEAVEILTENIMHNLNNNMENHENNENLGDEDDYRNDEADNKKNLYEPHKFYKKTRKFDEISENVDKNM